MKVDFNEVALKNVEDVVINIPDFRKIIANTVYMNAKSIDLLELARKINAGPTDMTEAEIAELKNLLTGDQSPVMAFVKKALLEYFDEVSENGA